MFQIIIQLHENPKPDQSRFRFPILGEERIIEDTSSNEDAESTDFKYTRRTLFARSITGEVVS